MAEYGASYGAASEPGGYSLLCIRTVTETAVIQHCMCLRFAYLLNYRTKGSDMAVTKSSLYRGPVTQTAIAATLAAVQRIEVSSALKHVAFEAPSASLGVDEARKEETSPRISVGLAASKEFAEQSVTTKMPFLGGQTRSRPLLKAAQRCRNFATDSKP